jgi:hypothetical protein
MGRNDGTTIGKATAHMLAGGSAGMAAKSTVAPLERAKIIMQTQVFVL